MKYICEDFIYLVKLIFMLLRTEQVLPKKFIGFSTKTSLANDQTAKVWQQLMPRLKEVKNLISSDLFSLQVYDFENFAQTVENPPQT